MKKKKRSVFLKILVGFLIFVLVAAIGVGIFAAIYIAQCGKDLPDISKLSYSPEQSSQIFDYKGNLITNVYAFENRVYVPLNEISDIAKKAVIAEEDERFYEHGALDYKGIMRALIQNIKHGKIVQGGSTITQQLARSLFLTRKQTIKRKVKEALLAIKLEKKFTKDQILEMYLNEVYFGSGAYGIESAAETYFGKHASELTLPEAAMLAGIIKAPSDINPFVDLKAAKEAQKIVLAKMVDAGYITEQEAKEAYDTPLKFAQKREIGDNMGYVIDYVKEKVAEKFGEKMLYEGGLKIYTTIRPELQKAGTDAINKVLTDAEDKGIFPKGKKNHLGVIQPQAALTAIDTKTGAILAMVGGRDYNNTKYNRTLALKQPGSSFKIFDYTSAIALGSLTPSSIILSAPYKVKTVTGVWEPHEWIGKNKYFGDMSVYRALALSSNVCAAKVSQRIGLDTVVYFARKFGISTPLKPYPSIAIGSFEVKQLEMADAYAVLGDGGVRHPPYIIRKIVSPDGQVLYKHKDNSYRVVSPQVAYIMNKIFGYVMSTEVNARIKGLPAAGKTGSTDNWTDAWFDGYTPNISVSVWVGPDSNEVTFPGVINSGMRFPAMIWHQFMLEAMNEFPKDDFAKPKAELIPKRVYDNTGYRTKTTGKGTTVYNFLPDAIPPEDIRDNGVVTVKICKDSGLLAPPNCPSDLVEEKTFIKGTEPTEVDPRDFNPNPPPPTPNPDEKNIKVVFTTDKDTYKAGDFITLTAKLENTEDTSGLRVTFIVYNLPVATLSKPSFDKTYRFKIIASIPGKTTAKVVVQDALGNTLATAEKEIIIESNNP
ncbi:MAG: PBP1A family penicillin-binding protein [Caldisericaceae bacterium]|nr:PBP1A family penicillin-binding protein [Caldisericaceae bacterium]